MANNTSHSSPIQRTALSSLLVVKENVGAHMEKVLSASPDAALLCEVPYWKLPL